MTSKEYKKIILDKLKEILMPRQFKKSGNNFHYSNGDLTYFIGLQSSQSSTSTVLKVTLNLEIASSFLSKLDDSGLPEIDIRHYHARIGTFLDGRPDKWWTIENNQAANLVANEIIEILNTKVFILFNQLKTTKDLVSLWQHGQGQHKGLTEIQIKKYIQLYFDNVN